MLKYLKLLIYFKAMDLNNLKASNDNQSNEPQLVQSISDTQEDTTAKVLRAIIF
jgi:hypothetical protein